MLRKGLDGPYHSYQHAFRASVGDYGQCDVFKFSYATCNFNVMSTHTDWLIINDSEIVWFGDIPKDLKQEVCLLYDIFKIVSENKNIGTDEVIKKLMSDPEYKELGKTKLNAFILKLVNEKTLERGENRSLKIPD